MTEDLTRSAAPAETAAVFRELAALVYDGNDFDRVYQAVVDAAPRLVEGCDHASLMLARDGRYLTAAATDEIARRIDGLELELGEGPCLDAIEEASVYHDAVLTDGSPWPRLAERVVAETPVRGAAGFRLQVGQEKGGSLNLFSDSENALTQESVDQGILLASFVGVAVAASHERRNAETLRAGLASNREIGKAVGLMMAFHKINAEEAFAMLRSASQDMNLKLAEVARQVVEHHNQP